MWLNDSQPYTPTSGPRSCKISWAEQTESTPAMISCRLWHATVRNCCAIVALCLNVSGLHVLPSGLRLRDQHGACSVAKNRGTSKKWNKDKQSLHFKVSAFSILLPIRSPRSSGSSFSASRWIRFSPGLPGCMVQSQAGLGHDRKKSFLSFRGAVESNKGDFV